MLASCFCAKYNSVRHQETGASHLIRNFEYYEKATDSCEKCVEFTNNLSKHAIIKRNVKKNNLKNQQNSTPGNSDDMTKSEMTKTEECISNIIAFFNSLKLQRVSHPAGKHFKLTCCNVEYTVGVDFLDILQTFIFGEVPKFNAFSDSCKPQKKGKKCLQKSSSPSPNIVFHKPPRKGTLKYRRWKLNRLQTESSYEDDLFDSSCLSNNVELCEGDSDSCDKYKNAPTPKMNFSLSPRESDESSEHEDFSTEDFQAKRKVAEEYQFRLKQKRKKPLKAERHSPYSSASKVDPAKALLNAARVLEEFEAMQEESDSESSHSSDSSDLC